MFRALDITNFIFIPPLLVFAKKMLWLCRSRQTFISLSLCPSLIFLNSPLFFDILILYTNNVYHNAHTINIVGLPLETFFGNNPQTLHVQTERVTRVTRNRRNKNFRSTEDKRIKLKKDARKIPTLYKPESFLQTENLFTLPR